MRKITKNMLAFTLCLSLPASMAGCNGGGGETQAETSSAVSNETATVSTEASTAETTTVNETQAEGIFTAGTYTGTGNGRNGIVEVKVELDSSKIINVEITGHTETEGIAEPALEKIPQRIIEQQSLGVDVVSGATITSNAILEAVADCIKQAGGDVEALSTKQVIDEGNKEVEETEADVVVIGAGAAGSAAALSAIQNNKKVILLEKTPQPMGAGTLAGGMFAADSKLQKESGQEVDKGWLYEQYMNASEGYMNSILVRRIIDESGATVDWLMENGMQLNLVDAGSGSSYNHIGMPTTLHGYAEGGTVAITKLVGVFEESGGEVRWSTPATDLIVENGTVTGVIAQKEDGSELRIKAKSVIIATGGFGGNEEMLKKYIGESYTMGEVLQNTGDGIQMAWKAGADKYGTEVTHYFWETFKGEEIGALAGVLGDDWFSLTDWTMFPNLRVNALGQRFSDETNVSLFAIHGAELAMQPGQIEYVILDDSVLQAVAENGVSVIEDQYAKWIGDEQFYMEFNEPNSTDAYYAAQHTPTDFRPIFDSVLKSGVVFKANTIEELAGELGMKPEVLKASVDQYNGAIASGKDEQFFADTSRLVEIKEGPYYAIKFCARNLSTLGGIRINENMEVLDKDFQVIEGLYAAGADAGGMYGKAYVDFEGGTLGFAYTSGRLAGIHASEHAD